jgi:ATP-dependent Lon protease
VLIPQENEKDLQDIPDNVKNALEIVPVSTVDEVLARALSGPLTPVEWHEDEEPLAPATPAADDAEAVITH